MSTFLADKYQFMVDNFPKTKGRIAHLDYAQELPVPSKRLREKFEISSGTPSGMAAMHAHVLKQITVRDEELKGFTIKLCLENAFGNWLFSDIISKKTMHFRKIGFFDDGAYYTDRGGFIAYTSEMPTTEYPLEEQKSEGSKGYPTPMIEGRTYSDFIFLHELAHALQQVYLPLNRVVIDDVSYLELNQNELAADAFAVLVMAASGEYPDLQIAAETLAHLRLMNGCSGSSGDAIYHTTTPAIRAAIAFALTSEGMALTPMQAFEKATEIARQNPVFKSEMDVSAAVKIAKNDKMLLLQKEELLMKTSLGNYSAEYESLKRKSFTRLPVKEKTFTFDANMN